MADNKFRPLTDLEREIINTLLSVTFPGCNQLKEQTKHSTATSALDPDNYNSIYLKSNSSSKAEVKNRIPVEATIKDEDGVDILILLHVIDGYINELEILKADGSDIVNPINPKKMIVKVNS